MVKDSGLTEDAVQQAFLIAFSKLGTLRDKSKFSPWVITIAVNEAKTVLNRISKHKTFSIAEKSMTNSLSISFPEKDIETKDLVTRTLSILKSDDAEILLYRYYLDWTIEEIAENLKISISNTKVRLHRARQDFKRLYNDQEGTSIEEGGC